MASQPLKAATTNVLIVDDETGVRDAVALMVKQAGHAVHTAASVAKAKLMLESEDISVVITDIYMPENDDLAFLHFLQEKHPAVPVLVMTGDPTLETAVGALRLKAVDYVAKPVTPESLGSALDAAGRVLERQSALARAHDALGAVLGGASKKPVSHLSKLSIREQEVAQSFMEGMRPKDIGNALHISESTVRNHFKAIYRKLGVHSQVELQSLLRGE